MIISKRQVGIPCSWGGGAITVGAVCPAIAWPVLQLASWTVAWDWADCRITGHLMDPGVHAYSWAYCIHSCMYRSRLCLVCTKELVETSSYSGWGHDIVAHLTEFVPGSATVTVHTVETWCLKFAWQKLEWSIWSFNTVEATEWVLACVLYQWYVTISKITCHTGLHVTGS